MSDSSLECLHHSHHARQDLSSDGHATSKGAFLVDVGALNGILWHFEAQTMFLCHGESPCQYIQAGPYSYFERRSALLVGTLSLNVCHPPDHLQISRT